MTAAEVRTQSSDVVSEMFHGSPPTASHYLILVTIDQRYIHMEQRTLTSICGRAKLAMYTRYSDERSLQLEVPYKQMQKEINGAKNLCNGALWILKSGT